jgi:hypothetical protein
MHGGDICDANLFGQKKHAKQPLRHSPLIAHKGPSGHSTGSFTSSLNKLPSGRLIDYSTNMKE